MDVKRYFRGPVMWIVLAVLAVVVLMNVVGSGGGYKSVETSEVIKAINSGQVQSAKLTTGDSQMIKIELKKDQKLGNNDGTKFQANYIGDQGVQLAQNLQTKYEAGQITDGYTVSPDKTSPFLSVLFSLLPFVLIVVVFLFLMNQMQGGGSRVMNFGKSKAKLITKDTPKTTFADVAGSDEAVEELHEIKEFLQEPHEVPGRRCQDPQGRAALRPARHRQDPARACRRGRGRCSLLLDLRFRLRRDVRRCRRLARPRPVRAGQGQRAG